MRRRDEPAADPRLLRRRVVLILVVYFFAGNVSQKMVPGIDEVFPFFGWSLFSRIPNVASRYSAVLHEHNGRPLDPPISLLLAPESMVSGNRYIADKVVKALSMALEKSDSSGIELNRRLLEGNYLRGRVRYELVFESFEPLERWRHGTSRERRSLGTFQTPGKQRKRDG